MATGVGEDTNQNLQGKEGEGGGNCKKKLKSGKEEHQKSRRKGLLCASCGAVGC